MCGIAGATAQKDQIAVLQCLRQLQHRGPDDCRVWNDPEKNITFGCTRLATTGTGPGAQQPVQTRDGRFVLAFNGYVAGHRRMIDDLAGQGVSFKSDSDAELVLQVLARAIGQGEDIATVLGKLSGQYALAFWDCKTARLWLARDPLGIKPLYVMFRSSGDIAFASELMVLDVFRPLEAEDGPTPEYLAHLFVPSPKSGVRDVELPVPGAVICWQDGTVARTRIVSPQQRVIATGKPHGRGKLVNSMRHAVRQSVADAMNADCAVGCLVSGGVDSAAVAALACDVARMRGQEMPPAFVMGFDNPAMDETEAARELCAYTGQQLHVVRAPSDPQEIYEELCKGLISVGAPFANPSIVLMRCLSREVGRHVRVCLSGDGGDELFGGYPRYRAGLVFDRFWRYLPGTLRRFCVHSVGPYVQRNPGRFLAGAKGSADHAFRHWNNRCAMPELDARICTASFTDIPDAGVADALMRFDRDVTLPGNQLLMSDRCGMSFGLEYRLPLLGHDVVRLASTLPAAAHLKGGGKAVWRQAIGRYLPAGHLDRPKIGFNPPVSKWLEEVSVHLWGREADILNALFEPTAISGAQRRTCWVRAVSGQDPDMALSVWALLVWQTWKDIAASRFDPVRGFDDDRKEGPLHAR